MTPFFSQQFVYFVPKVFQQCGSVFKPIRPDSVHPVPVVKRTAALTTGPARLPDGMSVVKSNQAAAIRPCAALTSTSQPMRPIRSRRYSAGLRTEPSIGPLYRPRVPGRRDPAALRRRHLDLAFPRSQGYHILITMYRLSTGELQRGAYLEDMLEPYMAWQHTIYLGPPVITHDGDTLKISREGSWGPMKAALSLLLTLWLVAWAFAEYRVGRSVLFNIPEPHKGPPALFGVDMAVVLVVWRLGALRAWHRMVFLEREIVSVDSRELRVSRKWADNWKTQCYPLAGISNVRTRRYGLWGRYEYRLGFDFRGKSRKLQPASDEPENLTMLDALQEHLVRQQVQ